MQLNSNKRNKTKSHYHPSFNLELNLDWFKGRKYKVNKHVNNINVSYDKARINTNGDDEVLYNRLKDEVKDISKHKNIELKNQREKINQKTETKLKEIALIVEEYISDKLNDNQDLLLTYHDIITYMNSLLKLYNDLQLRMNAIRISNNALIKQVKDEKHENQTLIKNLFYYKASIKQLLGQINTLQDKAKDLLSKRENKTIEKEIIGNKRMDNKMILNRINNNKIQTIHISTANNKNRTLSNFHFGTTTSSYTNEKSTQYVSNLYKTMNTFNFKKNDIFNKVLNTSNKTNKIYKIILSSMNQSEERYKKLNETSLKVFKKGLSTHQMMEEKGYRQMFIESLVNDKELNQISEGKLFPELTAFSRIINKVIVYKGI